ncbi:MAG: serine acetyltransferase [Clostridiales bacterium]|nr:serine acetyltransferase [Clostridiales bacterium]
MELRQIEKEILKIYDSQETTVRNFPTRDDVKGFLNELRFLYFPVLASGKENACRSAYKRLQSVQKRLKGILLPVLAGDKVKTEQVVAEFMPRTTDVLKMLLKDLQAFYEGDPAAKTLDEIMLCYPGFYAVTLYRIAHELFLLGVPYLPRMITEIAHNKTGIDIHPGAKIGEYFFIDHGTGIVVGETTEIGHHVRLYQGVTLGAKSFRLDEGGNPIKGGKRHPTIGNNVIIYANATILGGDTVVGDGAVIGGNVWLTESVDAGKIVYYNKEKRG